MLLGLSYVGLVDKVARHCNGVFQVLHFVRAASWHKEKVAGGEVDTKASFYEIQENCSWSLVMIFMYTQPSSTPIVGQGNQCGR